MPPESPSPGTEARTSGNHGIRPIRVFVIESQRTMLWGLERLIESGSPELVLAGACTGCAGETERIRATRPEVIVFSLDPGNGDGIGAISTLIATTGAKVLVLSGVRDTAVHDLAVLAGARGVVDKNVDAGTLIRAIKRIHEGELWLDRATVGRVFVEFSRRGASHLQAADRAQARIASLTPREREVILWLLAEPDASTRDVASRMSISEQTLRNHLSAIYDKLGVASRLALYVYAQRNGLAEGSCRDVAA